MGYGILATVEKYDLSDLKQAKRRDRSGPIIENEHGLAPRKIWSPGIGSRFGQPDKLQPYEVAANWSPLKMPGIDLTPADFRIPDTVEQLLGEIIAPLDYVEAVGNLVTTNGANKIWKLWCNQGALQANDATHTRLGVGSGSTAAAAGDTDLTGPSKWFQLLDGAGTVTTNAIAMTATHPTGQSNFAWAEYGVDSGTSSAATVTSVFINHAVVSLGTKTSAAAWAFTVTLTLS